MPAMIESTFKNWKQNWVSWLFILTALFLLAYFNPLGNKSEYNFIMLKTGANSIKAPVLKGNKFKLLS